MNEQEICCLCNEGTLFEHKVARKSPYKGALLDVETVFSVCMVCGAELTDPRQARLNKQAVVRARKAAEGIPSGAELRQIRRGFGISQEQAGRIFGGGPVAFSKYERDDILPDTAMGKLLKLAARHPEVIGWLAEDEGIALQRPRAPAPARKRERGAKQVTAG